MLITSNTRYLVIPTSREAKKSPLSLFDGELLIDLNVRVDFARPETVFYYDLSPYMGRNIEIRHESGRSFGYSANRPSRPTDAKRPLAHFTAEEGWLNDPNGLCLYEGKYHLFFQHNPVGLEWGNMHWGHAVSSDLIHWEELGDVLYPDEMGDMYSGSAIIDKDNLLGLKENEHDPLILFYTAAGGERRLSAGQPFTQCIAYSTDGGFTFRKWAKNPAVPHIKGANRDPKVVRDPKSGVYVMSLYLDGDEYAILTSSNLADWTKIQTLNLPGDNECPDLVPTRNEKGELRWLFIGAHDCALVGGFNPEKGFTSSSLPTKLSFGVPYAAQSFNLGDDSRRVRLSWNRIGGTDSFTHSMSLPCELTVNGSSPRILPAKEWDDALLTVEDSRELPAHGIEREVKLPCDITLEYSKLEEDVKINLCGSEITLSLGGELTVNGARMPFPSLGEGFGMRIAADKMGLELFDLEGRVYGAFELNPVGSRLTLSGEGSLDRLVIRTLR